MSQSFNVNIEGFDVRVTLTRVLFHLVTNSLCCAILIAFHAFL